MNEKTHALWSHRQLVERIRLTFEDGGITVETVSEQVPAVNALTVEVTV